MKLTHANKVKFVAIPAIALAAGIGFDSAARPDRPKEGRLKVKVTVLVPAHNEAQDIGTTIESIRGQSRPPDEIAVMCGNYTRLVPADAYRGVLPNAAVTLSPFAPCVLIIMGLMIADNLNTLWRAGWKA